jgi:diadenylate cyclase
MEFFTRAINYLKSIGIYMTTIQWRDALEIVIIAFLLYYILAWMKRTHAWSLLKGMIVIAIFLLTASILKLDTILWIAQNVVNYAIIALLLVLQPELRMGLDNLGKNNLIGNIIPVNIHHHENEGFSEETIPEIVKACTEMGKAKTGALIVIQRSEMLDQYETTGIAIDGKVTSGLLINIFEKNTPLHDGAVVVRGDRITSATCYLPLSDNRTISKELGTRHRAGLGIAEATDSMTVIVSEETGRISVAFMGQLYHGLSADELKEQLGRLQDKAVEEKKRFLWRGRSK